MGFCVAIFPSNICSYPQLEVGSSGPSNGANFLDWFFVCGFIRAQSFRFQEMGGKLLIYLNDFHPISSPSSSGAGGFRSRKKKRTRSSRLMGNSIWTLIEMEGIASLAHEWSLEFGAGLQDRVGSLVMQI